MRPLQPVISYHIFQSCQRVQEYFQARDEKNFSHRNLGLSPAGESPKNNRETNKL